MVAMENELCKRLKALLMSRVEIGARTGDIGPRFRQLIGTNGGLYEHAASKAGAHQKLDNGLPCTIPSFNGKRSGDKTIGS